MTRLRSELTGTRARIVDMLRRAPLTAKEIASGLEITHNAVRAHLAALQHAGLVQEGGMKPSASRPSVVYELASEADAQLSRAYIPFVAQLVRVLGERLQTGQLDELMH